MSCENCDCGSRCGHCKRLAQVWEQLGDHYRENDQVEIVKVEYRRRPARGIRSGATQPSSTLHCCHGSRVVTCVCSQVEFWRSTVGDVPSMTSNSSLRIAEFTIVTYRMLYIVNHEFER